MFPNPQAALPLPALPSLEHYRRIARQLTKAVRSGDEAAVRACVERWAGGSRVDEVAEFVRRSMSESGSLLADAHLVIARSHGFESWSGFAKHIEQLALQRSSVARFEAAAESIVCGDVETLKRLLCDDAGLIRARSTREHHATLLHYVSANGIEGYRQKTPPNIVAISALLLESGAEIDAAADVYGGGWTALGLAATSTPPLRAGVQNALLALLVDRGASIDLAPRGHNLIVECIMNGCPGAAEFLASRGAALNIEAAAAVGRLDTVERLLSAERPHMQRAFLFACGSGHDHIVEFLLRNGADLSDQAGTSEAALHWAVMGGHVSTIQLLISHGASLEELNGYGGTPLGQALWSFVHDATIDHVPAIEALLAAGAEIENGTPEWIERQEGRSAGEKARLIEVLRRHGANS